MHQVKKRAALLSSLLPFRKHQPAPPTVLYIPSLSYTKIYYFCNIFKKKPVPNLHILCTYAAISLQYSNMQSTQL